MSALAAIIFAVCFIALLVLFVGGLMHAAKRGDEIISEENDHVDR